MGGIFIESVCKVEALHDGAKCILKRSRLVASEAWRTQQKQKGHLEKHSSTVLEIPGKDAQELVMDLFRHRSEVAVVGLSPRRVAVHVAASGILKNQSSIDRPN